MLPWKCVRLSRKAQRCEEIAKRHDGENIKDSLCRQPIPVVLVLMFEDTDEQPFHPESSPILVIK